MTEVVDGDKSAILTISIYEPDDRDPLSAVVGYQSGPEWNYRLRYRTECGDTLTMNNRVQDVVNAWTVGGLLALEAHFQTFQRYWWSDE